MVPVTKAGTYYNPIDSAISIELEQFTENNKKYVEATIKVGNIKTETIITPIHFNGDVLRVADKSGNQIESGIKSPYDDIGITPLEALNNGWGGWFFINDYYPELNNEGGFYRLVFERRSGVKEISSAEALISIRFIVIGTGETDIRFADKNDKLHDITYTNGACFMLLSDNPYDTDIPADFQNISTQKLNVRIPNEIEKTIKNISGKELKCTSIIAVYDGYKMVDLSIKNINIPINGSATHECDIGVKENEVRHFLINNFTTLTPITGAAEVD